MVIGVACAFRSSPRNAHAKALSLSRRLTTKASLIRIENGTFYRRQPSTSPSQEEALNNPPLFPGLDLDFPATSKSPRYWCIVGPSGAGKTTLLEILQGKHLCFPPRARSYPYLSSDAITKKDISLRHPSRAIQYVGFDSKQRGLSGLGSYMSARYESRREATDFSVHDFLKGNTQLNALEDPKKAKKTKKDDLFTRVVDDLDLGALISQSVTNLSNGQTRRLRIAKALLTRPELLLLDEPFMGLDPATTVQLSLLLGKLAATSSPRIMLALRPQDPIPYWTDHVLFLDENLRVTHRGTRAEVTAELDAQLAAERASPPDRPVKNRMPRFNVEFGRIIGREGILPNPAHVSEYYRQSVERHVVDGGLASVSTIGSAHEIHNALTTLYRKRGFRGEHLDREEVARQPIVVEASGVKVRYGDTTILGDWQQPGFDTPGLHWTVRAGSRWGLFGPNGSGKTTLLSMILSDHPQAYAEPLRVFGRHRLPQPGQPGMSVFELQSRIGHSSPEVHAFFPRGLSVRRTLESAWAETPLGRPKLDVHADERVDVALRWFQEELNPALGMHEETWRAVLRKPENSNKSYVKPGQPETYRLEKEKYFYEVRAAQAASIEWADDTLFGSLTVSSQRVALFLRAILKEPELLILDEAFSGMDDVVRDKCMLFLESGETRRLGTYDNNHVMTGSLALKTMSLKHKKVVFSGLKPQQALISIAHVKEEVPVSVADWLWLPPPGVMEGKEGKGLGVKEGKGKAKRAEKKGKEKGKEGKGIETETEMEMETEEKRTRQACRMGTVGEQPLRRDYKLWARIWGVEPRSMG